MNIDNYIKISYEVIDKAIEALNTLKQSIDENFLHAVEKICACNGRIIVSGMGKSGHIGKKFASTLASTGTPALFVHPSEASHGDLGMISTDDIIILISNSGETSELNQIIDYAKRFSITIIAIVSQIDSTLAKSSDIVLLIPNIGESNKIGAPTTSTSSILVLCDAVATAVLENKGFTKDSYRLLHPGGKIGSNLLTVQDIMHKIEETPVASLNQKMSDILITMTTKGFGAVAIIDEETKLIGIITDGDLRRHMCSNFVDLTATEVMTKNPKTIEAKSLAIEALNLMNKKAITCLFVQDEDQKLKGIIHIHDCLRMGIR